MDQFKKIHNITKEIILESKVETGRLFVYYGETWIPLTKKKCNKFYAVSTLQSKYGFKFCHELGLITKQSCSKEYFDKYYKNNKEKIKYQAQQYYVSFKRNRRKFERNRNKLETKLTKIWRKKGLITICGCSPPEKIKTSQRWYQCIPCEYYDIPVSSCQQDNSDCGCQWEPIGVCEECDKVLFW